MNVYIKAAATKYIETSQMKRTNFDGEGTEQADGNFYFYTPSIFVLFHIEGMKLHNGNEI